MRTKIKKILSLFTVMIMVSGLFVMNFSVYSASDLSVDFILNGGQFKNNTVKNKYNVGEPLPSCDEVIRDGFVFAGWYDNTDFTGSSLYVVPADTDGQKTYYAKWVTQNTLYYDGFEKNKLLVDWSAGGTTLSVNTEAENIYSGERSMKYEIPANKAGNIAQSDGVMVEGDGIYFWIKADKATTLYLQFMKKSENISSYISVPAGKSIVAVPWSYIKNIPAQGQWAGSIQIIIKASAEANTVYIDNIATYNNCSAVSFKLNGGIFVNEAPLDYSPGMVLPTYEGVVKKGFMFAGWYDNDRLSGNAVTFIPTDATGSQTYYAKWVIAEVNGDNFESYKNTAAVSVTADGALTNETDMISGDNKHCYYWSGVTDAKAQLNTDKAHAYSGKKSVKLYLPKKNNSVDNWRNYSHFAIPNHSVDGDGAYFWLETDKAVTIRVMFQYRNAKTAAVTVPAGKHLITVPWTSVTGSVWGKQMLIEFTHTAEDNTVYLDDFGTYESVDVQDGTGETGIEFNLGGGSFKDYMPPTDYIPKMPLPTYENVTMENHTFAGWYDNAGFKGLPVFFVPANASGHKVYYARWVDCDAAYDSFENYTGKESQDTENFWGRWTESGRISLNTDASHAYSGKKSLKVSVNNRSVYGDDSADLVMKRDLHRNGDGIFFWIETELTTQVWMRFNFTKSSGGFTTAKVTVPAGKNLVMLPWEEIPQADVRNLWWLVEIHVATPALAGIENTVYIDEVGTFKDYIENIVSFELNGGAFTDDYTAPSGYYSKVEYKLPTEHNVVNNGLTFAGWYDNAKLSGSPVTAIPAGESGEKTYYAKWIVRDISFDDFENGLGVWQNWGEGSSNLSIEPKLFQGGGQSLRYEITKNLNWNPSIYIKKDLPITGDGLSFRIKTEQESTITLRFNHLTNLCALDPIHLLKGESLVSIPWSAFGDKLSGINKLTEMQIIVGRTQGDVYCIDEIGTFTENTASAGTIAYKSNGGVWTDGYTAPTRYANGGLLPSGKCLTRKGCLFTGWYDNAELSGSPVTAIPVGSVGDKTCYAGWVKQKTLFDGFENGLGTANAAWQDWTGAAVMSLNTDSANVCSGKNSMKYEVSGKESYIFVTNRAFTVDGDGICFWIKTEKAAKLKIQLDHWQPTLKSKEISIPVGESFVTIPWSDITATGKASLQSWEFQIKTADAGNTYYIDDIGTYTANQKYTITYKIGNSEWADSYTPVTGYSDAGCDLPGYESIKNGMMTLAGWCEKQDCSDTPVLSVPAGSTGNKVFYPKWVGCTADYDTLENYKSTQILKTVWENKNTNTAEMLLNTDAAHAHYGDCSVKLTVKRYASQNDTAHIVNKTASLQKSGYGIGFFVEAEQATTVRLRLNYETYSKPGVITAEKYVPEGKSYIAIPWEELGVTGIKRLEIMIGVPTNSSTNTVYIDSIGTYLMQVDPTVIYNLNGGGFTDEASVSYERSLFDDTVLPTFATVQKEGFYFAGWYENEELTGTPLYLLTPSASKKELWAKWVEQDNRNHLFDNFADTQAMLNAEWSDYRGFEDWRINGGTTLKLNTDSANTAVGSEKSLQASYCVPDGQYIAGGEAPAALFKNYYWSTTFGTRAAKKEGDGIRFWIKSDRTATFSVVFSKAWLKFSYMPKITIPANVPVLVYLPWTALNNDGIEAYNLYEAGFEIYGNVGTAGTVWIDDLGIYYNEKIIDFVYENSDGDVRIMSYNNHIPKKTVVEIKKRPVSDLQKLGGKAPTGADINYLVDYMLQAPTGGAIDLSGPAWISFKLPKGADIGKLGMYEVFFDGSRAALNYTVEGEWITICTNNTSGTLMLTTNDTEWTPHGTAVENGIVQSLRIAVTKPLTTKTDDSPAEQPDQNQQGTDGDIQQSGTGNRRPPKYTSNADRGSAQESDIPWVLIVSLCVGAVVVIAAGVIFIVAVKRRRSKKQEVQKHE